LHAYAPGEGLDPGAVGTGCLRLPPIMLVEIASFLQNILAGLKPKILQGVHDRLLRLRAWFAISACAKA
jgi:hypothetical protein